MCSRSVTAGKPSERLGQKANKKVHSILENELRPRKLEQGVKHAKPFKPTLPATVNCKAVVHKQAARRTISGTVKLIQRRSMLRLLV